MYWDNIILAQIEAGLSVHIKIEKATLEDDYGRFGRILVDIDLAKNLLDSLMIERDGIVLLFLLNMKM